LIGKVVPAKDSSVLTLVNLPLASNFERKKEITENLMGYRTPNKEL
jgi:hypothetical protein